MGPTALVSSNITAKTAVCIGFWSPGERRKKTEAAHPESLPGTHQFTRTQSAVWYSSSQLPDGLASMWPLCRRSYQRCCPPSLMMCSNSMRPGALCANGATSAGCGRSCVVVPARSWPLCSGTAANRVVAVSGTRCHVHSADVSPIATSGKRIKRCFPKKPIVQSAKGADSYPIWSVGIVHCDKGKPAMSAKRSHSQRAMRTIIWSPTGLSLTTTWQ